MSKVLIIVAVATALLIVGFLYHSTESAPPDPCAGLDISAAALAERGRDQDNLVDNALIQRAECIRALKKREATGTESDDSPQPSPSSTPDSM